MLLSSSRAQPKAQSQRSSIGKNRLHYFCGKSAFAPFSKIGDAEAAAMVRRLDVDGTKLALYLATKRKWTCCYWNPDVYSLDPNTSLSEDDRNEHAATYAAAIGSGSYYGVKVDGFIVNYRPALAKTKLDKSGMEWLLQVPFAYGFARGAMHCFLISYGDVTEVHWDGIGPSLYETRGLLLFPWLSGAIMLPPDAPHIPPHLSSTATSARYPIT
jgi:hypothetical protein